MIVRPASTEEVSEIVRICNDPDPIVPQAAIPAYAVAQPHMSMAGKSCCR